MHPAERMARAAEADPPEPNDGSEQRGAGPQPPVLSQQQMELCQLHAALRQREMLTAGFKLTAEHSRRSAIVTVFKHASFADVPAARQQHAACGAHEYGV